MTWYLWEEEKPKMWAGLLKKLQEFSMPSSNILTALTVEIDTLKKDAEIAKREAEINKELAQDYKRKYETLLQIKADKKTSPEGEEREVFKVGGTC